MSHSDTQVMSIFTDAVECDSPEARAAVLDHACGDDAALRAEVEALLNAHDEAGNFLKGGNSPIDLAAAAENENVEAIGTIVGQFKLLEQIGEGGMGVVYMAEQERPVHRRVALKIIKPGMDTREVIARFEAERQALAMMEHPNIAKVHDAGATKHGRPYFVMELIKGIPITRYCDTEKLGISDRLGLFVQVCQAVQHAHQKGIIHRDLKPSNVLVIMHDDRPVPKIIDFGVAKAIEGKLTDRTLETGFHQLIGTPTYMSPEQAQLSGNDVDTRSDIYSLGVLLYELLTGMTPFDSKQLSDVPLDEMQRIIREVEPPSPSTRVSTLSAEARLTVAGERRIDSQRLVPALRGDLDWIVMRCLEKDRTRRYDTANTLALDIQRYLQHEPIEARPPTRMYRLRKFARRQRGLLVWAALVVATMLVGVVASISQAVRATKAEALAQTRLQAETTAHQEADESRARADESARLARQAIDDMYTQVAERWLAQQPQMEPVQREFLEKALWFYSELANEPGSEPPIRFETARAYRRIANIQHRLGQTSLAHQAYEEATNRLQALADEFPATADYRENLAATLHEFGVLLGDTGRYSDEEKFHRRALVLEERQVVEFPKEAAYRRDLGRGHWYVARVFMSQHHRREAEAAYRAALAIQLPLVAEFPAEPIYREHLAETQFGLGQVLRILDYTIEYRQALGDAARLYEQLATEFPNYPGYRNQLANVLYWLVRGLPPTEEAERYLRQSLALQERLAADFPGVADYRFDLFRGNRLLGWLLHHTNRPGEAEAAFRKATMIADQLVAESPKVHYYRGGLALTYISLGHFLSESDRFSDAENAYRQAIALLEPLVAEFPDVPVYRPDLQQTYFHLASVLNRAGRTQEAQDVRSKGLKIDPRDAELMHDVAWLLATHPDVQLRDPQKAIELAEQAVKLAPQKTKYWRTLAAARYRAGDWKAALAALEKAHTGQRPDKPFCCLMAMT
jgi:serine/threonine protein kinase/tetratricopeptide (TPR) repeat protein